MPESESLLENNLSFDYHFNAGSPGNICLCQAVPPPADVGNCWEGLLGELEESQTTGKCLGGCEEDEEEDERRSLLDEAPLPSSLPLVPFPLWSRDSQIKISITWKIILPSLGVPGFALGQWAAASDLTPATSHLPGEPGTRGKRMGAAQRGRISSTPMTQPMCRGRTGSPAPLGSSAAFWEHHSAGLGGFFWKMSPACDESAVPLRSLPTAPCEAWGCPHGHLPAALCAQIRERRGSAGSTRAGAEPRGCRAEFGQLEPRGQTDTPRGQGLQLPSPAQPFPALRGSSEPGSKGCASKGLPVDGEGGGKARGQRWKLRARMCVRCPGVLGGMLRPQISQKRQS